MPLSNNPSIRPSAPYKGGQIGQMLGLLPTPPGRCGQMGQMVPVYQGKTVNMPKGQMRADGLFLRCSQGGHLPDAWADAFGAKITLQKPALVHAVCPPYPPLVACVAQELLCQLRIAAIHSI